MCYYTREINTSEALMAKHHSERRWNSLTDLKSYIEAHVDDENFVSFDGFELITDRFTYRLCDSELTVIYQEEIE
jgi:hypothetical protein